MMGASNCSVAQRALMFLLIGVGVAASQSVRADDDLCPGRFKEYLCLSLTSVGGILSSPVVTSDVGFAGGAKGASLGTTLSTVLPSMTSQDLTALTLSKEEKDQLDLVKPAAKAYLVLSEPMTEVLQDSVDLVRDAIRSRTLVNPDIFPDEVIVFAIYITASGR